MSAIAEDAAPPTAADHTVAPPPPFKRSMGLVNQGCTCYLNSLLQLLFHLSYFRSAVYRMTLNRSDETSLIPQALQELFFQMQERNTAPTTKGLTDAFQWDEREVFVQHDIQELAALLRDNLETKMRGSPSEGAINRLFEGVGEQVVETLDGSYKSSVRDTFYDIHLSVSHPNIHEAMRSLIAKDQLVGDNKYKVEEEGKEPVYKDAQKGYRFVRLPPVILFHLKRFEMDFQSPMLEMRKVNNAFEFAETVDLREFESGAPSDAGANNEPPSEFDRDSQALYDLHAVIVHKGGVESGHYYSYIREYDAARGEYVGWLEYDDDRVTPVDSFTVIESNFGGYRLTTLPNRREVRLPVTHSAYILAYVRRADRNVVLAPSPTDIIPQRVKRELQRVMEADEHRHALEQAKALQIRLVLATHDSLAAYVRNHVYDLMNRDERLHPQLSTVLDVQKSTPMTEVYQRISQLLGPTEYPARYLKLWRWSFKKEKPNMHYRPAHCVREHEPHETVLQALDLASHDRKLTIMLFVERVAHPTQFAQQVDARDHVRIFIKTFSPQRNEVSYVGAIDGDQRQTVASLRTNLVQLLGVKDAALDRSRLMFESTEGLIEINAGTRLSHFETGDIFVIQLEQPGQSLCRNRSIDDVFQEARMRTVLSLRNIAAPHEVVAELCASSTWGYNKLTEAIARVLASKSLHKAKDPSQPAKTSNNNNVPVAPHPTHIQLYRNIDSYTPTPSITPHREIDDPQMTVHSLCTLGNSGTSRDYSPDIFFQVLPICRRESDMLCHVPATILTCDGKTVKKVKVQATMDTLLIDLIRTCLAAPAIASKKGESSSPSSVAASSSSTAVAGTSGDVASPPALDPATSQFVLQYIFDSHSRPWQYTVQVDLDDANFTTTLARQLQHGERIIIQATPTVANLTEEDGYCSPCSSEREEGEDEREDEEDRKKRAVEGESKPQRIPREIAISLYIPCGMKDYGSPNFPAFGVPFVLPITSWTTCQAVLEILVKHYEVPTEDINQYPLMMSVLEVPNHRVSFLSEGMIDQFMMRDKSYCFPEMDKHILPMLKPSLENGTVFVYVNRKHPKGKAHAGSRYFATNDPKLSLGKK